MLRLELCIEPLSYLHPVVTDGTWISNVALQHNKNTNINNHQLPSIVVCYYSGTLKQIEGESPFIPIHTIFSQIFLSLCVVVFDCFSQFGFCSISVFRLVGFYISLWVFVHLFWVSLFAHLCLGVCVRIRLLMCQLVTVPVFGCVFICVSVFGCVLFVHVCLDAFFY